MQLLVPVPELHTHEVTNQETVAQIKAHVASLKGIASEDCCAPGRHAPKERGYPGPVWDGDSDHSATLEVASRMLGGKVHGHAGKLRGQTPQGDQTGEKEDNWSGQVVGTVHCISSMLCPPFTRRAPMPTLKSFVILVFANKATQREREWIRYGSTSFQKRKRKKKLNLNLVNLLDPIYKKYR